MVMNENSVDKFLLSHKTEVEDNGFSVRVMQSLPENASLKHRLNRLWNTIFIVLLAVFCWQTNVLSELKVDIEVFINNLPLHVGDPTLWYSAGIIILGMYALVFAGGKKLYSL